MNGAKYDVSLYEWQPEPEVGKNDFFAAPVVAAAAPPVVLETHIVAAPPESVLARPVGELLASARQAVGGTVLGRPVSEVLSDARESLSRPRPFAV